MIFFLFHLLHLLRLMYLLSPFLKPFSDNGCVLFFIREYENMYALKCSLYFADIFDVFLFCLVGQLQKFYVLLVAYIGFEPFLFLWQGFWFNRQPFIYNVGFKGQSDFYIRIKPHPQAFLSGIIAYRQLWEYAVVFLLTYRATLFLYGSLINLCLPRVTERTFPLYAFHRISWNRSRSNAFIPLIVPLIKQICVCCCQIIIRQAQPGQHTHLSFVTAPMIAIQSRRFCISTIHFFGTFHLPYPALKAYYAPTIPP